MKDPNLNIASNWGAKRPLAGLFVKDILARGGVSATRAQRIIQWFPKEIKMRHHLLYIFETFFRVYPYKGMEFNLFSLKNSMSQFTSFDKIVIKERMSVYV